MKITVLVENTSLSDAFRAEHGLSLLIRTGKRTILFDGGQTDAPVDNAEAMGIDLAEVDLAVVSHGHYDHTGGFAAFRLKNPEAPVYVRENAFGKFMHGEKYIGVPDGFRNLPGLVPVGAERELFPGALLFSNVRGTRRVPAGNGELTLEEHGLCRADGFGHEQNLLLCENGRYTLLAGCAHCGILNILDACRARIGRYPDTVIGGFHMMKETDEAYIAETARGLAETGANFYTGHCTGSAAFDLMKSVLGDKLCALSAGLTFFA